MVSELKWVEVRGWSFICAQGYKTFSYIHYE